MFGNDDTTMNGPVPSEGEGMGSSTSAAAAPPPVAAPATGAPQAAADAGAPPARGASAPISPAAPPEHENPGMKILHGILGALGGTQETQVARDPETGKMVVTAVKSGPGQQWKRIIAGALTGAAAGASVKGGPGRIGRAAGAGFGAGEDMVEKQDQNKIDAADKDFDAQQKVIVRKAQVAQMNQEIASSAWRMTREKADFVKQNTEASASMHNLVTSNPGNQDFGHYKSFADFLDKHSENGQQIGQMNANMELRAMPEFDADGKPNGVRIYKVTPGWNEQKNIQPIKVDFGPKINPDGTATSDIQTIPAGGMTNADIMNAQQAGAKRWLDYNDKTQVTPKEKFKEGEADKRNAADNAAKIEAATVAADSRSSVAADRSTDKKIVQHNKDYVKPANDVEKSYSMMQHAYDEYTTARKQGKELPTGAQSMLALSTHLATTFGNVKGSRVTKDMIQHHLGARSVSDSALVAIQKLTNGDALSPDQWDAFHDLIGESRRLSWETATKEAKRAKVPIDFLPADLQGLAAPKGATAEVYGPDNKTVIGHVVNNKYVALGSE